MLGNFKVVEVSHQSPYLQQVIQLGKSNADQIGFFPDGAYSEHARNGYLLAAIAPTGEVVGYVLYRITGRQVATLVHLCVASYARGNGIARKLFEALKSRAKHLRGVDLSCRHDFSVNALWPKLGFIFHSERPGRSKKGSRLIRWWYGFDHPDLLSDRPTFDDAVVAALDVNVFLDLHQDSHPESAGLAADWLNGVVTLSITPELRAELIRRTDSKGRERAIAFSRQFETLLGSQAEAELQSHYIAKILGNPQSTQDASDIRQLAWAAVGGADVFVTRDESLLSHAVEIERATAIKILRPSELISRVDSSLRESAYQRRRLAGTLFESKREALESEAQLATSFQQDQKGERKPEFLAPLREICATPESGTLIVVRDAERRPVAILAYERGDDLAIRVKRLRVANSSQIGTTSKYVVDTLVRNVSALSDLCVIEDRLLQPTVEAALSNAGFTEKANRWVKITFLGAMHKGQVLQQLALIARRYARSIEAVGPMVEALQLAAQRSSRADLMQLEAALWPAIVTDLDLPVFIVPIRPEWAQHFFDEETANQQLFGARADLALNDEAIYYRAVRNSGGLAAPARILWYVTKVNGMPESGHIKAASNLHEVRSGSATDLFRAFRRLGIYQWYDVVATAKGDPNGIIMALHFGRTQRTFIQMPFHSIKARLQLAGINTQLQSPVRIPSELYYECITRYARIEEKQ